MAGGRPTAVTEEARAEFLEHLRGGNYRCAAAKAAGFSKSSLDRFLKSDDPAAPKFREDMLRAEAYAETKVVSVLHKLANDEDTDAAKWYLARKFPDRWGEHREVGRALARALKDVEELRERLQSAQTSGNSDQPTVVSQQADRPAV